MHSPPRPPSAVKKRSTSYAKLIPHLTWNVTILGSLRIQKRRWDYVFVLSCSTADRAGQFIYFSSFLPPLPPATPLPTPPPHWDSLLSDKLRGAINSPPAHCQSFQFTLTELNMPFTESLMWGVHLHLNIGYHRNHTYTHTGGQCLGIFWTNMRWTILRLPSKSWILKKRASKYCQSVAYFVQIWCFTPTGLDNKTFWLNVTLKAKKQTLILFCVQNANGCHHHTSKLSSGWTFNVSLQQKKINTLCEKETRMTSQKVGKEAETELLMLQKAEH